MVMVELLDTECGRKQLRAARPIPLNLSAGYINFGEFAEFTTKMRVGHILSPKHSPSNPSCLLDLPI